MIFLLFACGSTPLWIENKVLSLEQENFQQDEELLLLRREVESLREEIQAMTPKTPEGVTPAR